MAKRFTVAEATMRIIDRINITADPESADIDKYMRQYASIKELSNEEYEKVYKDISESLFGHWTEEGTETETATEEPEKVEETTALEVVGTTALATLPGAQEATGEPTSFLTMEDIGYILEGLGELAGMVLDEVRADIPLIARRTTDLLQVLGMVGLNILDALAFWAPQLAHRLLFWLAWVARPEMERKARAARRTWTAMGIRARATARVLRTDLTALQGAFTALWELRMELIDEYREVA